MDADVYGYDKDSVMFYWDVETAEKIMGWKVITDEEDNCVMSVFDEVNGTSYYMPLAPKEDREWSPMQNIEQAFQVLEKTNCTWQIQSAKQGYRVCLQVYSNEVRPYTKQIQIEEETLAEAICLAVLSIPDAYLTRWETDNE